MSVIKEIEISGIRSYKPGIKQNLKIYNPLTLIIGPNGSGKTTIVEALKYVITNEQPPNSKNGAFLYDINLINMNKNGLLNKIESYVKIKFISLIDQKEYQLIRRLVQIRTNKKVSIRTLESTLTCKEKPFIESTYTEEEKQLFKKLKVNEIENYENKILLSGSKISDTDKNVLFHLNITKALVDNVLLVHQNDSTWPLSDSLNVKKRMDAILDSEKYIKLIEDLKLERRRLNNITKLLEQKHEFTKTLRNKSQLILDELEKDKTILNSKSLDYNNNLNKVNIYQLSKNKYINRIKDLEFKINLLKQSNNKLLEMEITIEDINKEINEDINKEILIEDINKEINKEKELKEEIEKEKEEFKEIIKRIDSIKRDLEINDQQINKRVLDINTKILTPLLINIDILNPLLINEDILNSYLIKIKENCSLFMERYFNKIKKIEKYINYKEKIKETEETRNNLINKIKLNKPELNYEIEIKTIENEINILKHSIKECYEIYSSKEFQFKNFFEENYLKDFKNEDKSFQIFKYEEFLKKEIEDLKIKINKKNRINNVIESLKNLFGYQITEIELFNKINTETNRKELFKEIENILKNHNLFEKKLKNDVTIGIYNRLKISAGKNEKCPLCMTSLLNNKEFYNKLNKLMTFLNENSIKLKEKIIENNNIKLVNSSINKIKEEEDLLKFIEFNEIKQEKEKKDEKLLIEKEEIFINLKKYKTISIKKFNLKELNNNLELLIKKRDTLIFKYKEFKERNSTENDIYIKKRIKELDTIICNLNIELINIKKEIKELNSIETYKEYLNKEKENISKNYHFLKFNIKDLIEILKKNEKLYLKINELENINKNLKIKTYNKKKLKYLEDLLNYKKLQLKLLEFKKFETALKNIFNSLDENFNDIENSEIALNLSRIITTLDEFPLSDLINDTITDNIDSSIFDSKNYYKSEDDNNNLIYEDIKINELKQLIKENLYKLETIYENLRTSKKLIINKIDDKTKICHILEGEIKQLNNSIENKKKLFNDEYIYADKNLKKSFLELKIHELYIIDINEVISCSEQAMTDYHKQKVEEINQSLKILWENTCNNDIENIEMKIEFNKTYNYKLVMHKKVQVDKEIKTVEMDMRGRCSAGQAMIASILFRLALCENFINNPTIFALDEPTTNLDDENVESLGSTFRILLDAFKSHQFLIITHDERFMSMIQTGDAFYKLKRKNGECIIQNLNHI